MENTTVGFTEFAAFTIESMGVERLVNLSELSIDKSYQRGEKQSSKKIEKNFRPECAGHLIVCERPDGSLFLVDGQQRTKAMKALGLSSWKARVIKSGGPAFEASIFKTLNGGDGTITRVSAMELYNAKLVEGDAQALILKKVVEDQGFFIHPHRHAIWPNIGAVSGLMTDLKRYGPDTLSTALQVIKSVWPNQDLAIRHEVLRGMIISVSIPGVQLSRLMKIMERTPVQDIFQKAKAKGSNTPTHAARIILGYYNKGLRSNQVALPIDENE